MGIGGAIIALLVPAGASGAGPIPVAAIGSVDGRQLGIRPAQIDYELGSELAGARGAHNKPGRLRWASWTSRQALGSGYDWIEKRCPARLLQICPGFAFHLYAARVRLYGARQQHGHLVFTRMTITYTHAPPPGKPRARTLTAVYMSGGFDWNPTF
jgi:hypothetical protein